jgi:hypothetical protein
MASYDAQNVQYFVHHTLLQSGAKGESARLFGAFCREITVCKLTARVRQASFDSRFVSQKQNAP